MTTGLRDSTTIEKLLAIGSCLTLPMVVSICEAEESANEKCAAVTSSIDVLKNKSTYKAARKNAMRVVTGQSKFCGRNHELKKECCPANGKNCSRCQGKNHFAVKCTKVKTNTKTITSTPPRAWISGRPAALFSSLYV